MKQALRPRKEATMAELVLVLVLVLFLSSSSAALTTDGLALLALKSAVSADPAGALSAWLDSDATPCAWTGITCRHGRVVGLVLRDRALAGYLPSELSLLSALGNLSLPGNRLSGSIPSALGVLTSLSDLDLSRNNLSGPIPSELGRLSSLARLDLSSNHLSGPLPTALAALPHLSGVLNLSSNLLSGPIPSAFGDIPVAVSLDLRWNNLSGGIPPVGSLLSQGPTAFAGNPGLCGFPLKNSCPAPKQDPKMPKPNPTLSLNSGEAGPRAPAAAENRRKTVGTVPILAGVMLVAIASILLLQWHFRRRGAAAEGRASNKNEKGSANVGGGFVAAGLGGEERREGHESQVYAVVDEGFGLELEELLRASAYVVGKSRSGIVYKVVLGRDGSAVAVRRLSETDDGDPVPGNEWRRRRAFESEVAAIGRAKHPNVVRLLAYYFAPDERLLIYDYIPNGTLQNALHGGQRNPTAPALPWSSRLAILQGAARGVAYLHEFSPRKHAHGGIASSKILLDDELHPHISGFGLARLLAQSAIKKPATRAVGYLAPEARGDDGAVSQRADVYAFGIVALEVVTGREASTELEAWVRQAFREERPLSEVVDPALLHEVHAKREVLAVFHVALGCTEADPELRLRMRAVVESLERVGGGSSL
ncbi:hypothetical protein Cni_G02841 [Canna indica]|uniref:Protein kinase domain-containing protein n=1 Tax=Canna indica TaxID=4628 RepID=A0AAQ3JSL1_9LILI|nr:hypothetical protein Cni_G02841 [Canna indica]